MRKWKLVEPFVRVDEVNLRPQEVLHSRREIVSALFYRTRTGCQWQYLPHDFHEWQSVCHYFRLWKTNGVLKKMHDCFRENVRNAEGRATVVRRQIDAPLTTGVLGPEIVMAPGGPALTCQFQSTSMYEPEAVRSWAGPFP